MEVSGCLSVACKDCVCACKAESLGLWCSVVKAEGCRGLKCEWLVCILLHKGQ